MNDEIEVEDSCGNIFEDLGLPDPEWHLARADLALKLRSELRSRGLAKKEAVTIVGLTLSELDDLLRGRLGAFDIDRLIRLTIALGMDIRIQIAPRPSGQARANISVDRVETF